MIQLKMRCLDRPLLHLEWIWSEGPNLKVKPHDTSREPVHSKVGELSNSAHTLALSHSLSDNEEGTGGLYTYFGCLQSLDPLSPLPPTPLLQMVISSVLSLLISHRHQYIKDNYIPY